MPRRTIDPDNELERWRYRYPHGHVNWTLCEDHIYCKGCRHLGLDLDECRHGALFDKQTLDRIPRAMVEPPEDEDEYCVPPLEGRA